MPSDDSPMPINPRPHTGAVVPSQLRAAREAAGVSGAALARKAGLSVATITRVESGRRVSPSTLAKLTNALNDLVPRRPEPPTKHQPPSRGTYAHLGDFTEAEGKIGVQSPRLTPLDIRSLEPVPNLRLLRRESRLGGKLAGHLTRLTAEEHRARSERARRFLERPVTASASEEYKTVARHAGGSYGS